MQASNVTSIVASLSPSDLGMATFAPFQGQTCDCVDLAIAFHGAEHVDLPGFGQQDVQSAPWSHPTIAMVRPLERSEDALASLASDRRRGVALVLLACALLASGAYSAGIFAGTVKAWRERSLQPSSLAWTPVEVMESGLAISTAAGRVVVPLGGKLPNGDVLLSVQPARRLAVLSSSSLVIPERAARP